MPRFTFCLIFNYDDSYDKNLFFFNISSDKLNVFSGDDFFNFMDYLSHKYGVNFQDDLDDIKTNNHFNIYKIMHSIFFSEKNLEINLITDWKQYFSSKFGNNNVSDIEQIKIQDNNYCAIYSLSEKNALNNMINSNNNNNHTFKL